MERQKEGRREKTINEEKERMRQKWEQGGTEHKLLTKYKNSLLNFEMLICQKMIFWLDLRYDTIVFLWFNPCNLVSKIE